MSGLGDDLQQAKAGFFQVLEGATQLEQAATAVANKVDAAFATEGCPCRVPIAAIGGRAVRRPE